MEFVILEYTVYTVNGVLDFKRLVTRSPFLDRDICSLVTRLCVTITITVYVCVSSLR